MGVTSPIDLGASGFDALEGAVHAVIGSRILVGAETAHDFGCAEFAEADDFLKDDAHQVVA
jgi:hypothetical protein